MAGPGALNTAAEQIAEALEPNMRIGGNRAGARTPVRATYR